VKRKLVVIALSLIAAGASADIGVTWKNTTAGFFNNAAPPTGTLLGNDAVHLLIWSLSAPPSVDYALAGTGVGSGEIVLYTGPGPLSNSQFNYSGLVFNDTHVGGADINAGYLYSRIFQDSTVDVGDLYYQSPIFSSPALPEYDALTPSTVITHNTPASSGAIVLDLATTGVYTVVPEPSVLAFLGLGGLALAARRRFTA